MAHPPKAVQPQIFELVGTLIPEFSIIDLVLMNKLLFFKFCQAATTI